MIGRLKGEVVELAAGMVTVDVGGVGYEVGVPASVWQMLPPVGETVELRTRQVFREDAVTLYGFLTSWQRRLFDLLTEVKGCGPKIALSLIGQLGEESVAGAILGNDPRALSRAPGVGPRLAERIIIELKEKVAEENLGQRLGPSQTPRAAVQTANGADELVDALVALGYKRFLAEDAAREARQQAETVQDQLVAALRSLKR
jgi:holliday junction DNA helicase RuvA